MQHIHRIQGQDFITVEIRTFKRKGANSMGKKAKIVVLGILLVTIVLLIVLVGKPTNHGEKPSDNEIPKVLISNGKIVDGKDNWINFNALAESKKTARISMEYVGLGNEKGNNKRESFVIEYNGDTFSCEGEEYRYLLQRTGRMPHGEADTTYTFLANEHYSFDQISDSILSDNSEKQIEYKMIFCIPKSDLVAS